MAQTPGLKAAKAAGRQHLGKAQRTALEQAKAAAQKKAAGKKKGLAKRAAARKTAAKKTVPLPRGLLRAEFPGTCPSCLKDYAKGEVITKVADGWGHRRCAPRKLAAGEREFARNKARIESGEAFRARKPSDWRLGASPSNTRPSLNCGHAVVLATDEPSGQGGQG
ncbi:hypothetical protein OG194_00215 [Streptomyces sp. NBC_01288]|uniref:hypothetical protein n=1 Tax=Streptomyces sp. NBC_01288 TaxID=2903814 RepID=UPI002E12B872|nr:hypothetical protein OG194_00215 [Streptomyces sp. NBC_01288]